MHSPMARDQTIEVGAATRVHTPQPARAQRIEVVAQTKAEMKLTMASRRKSSARLISTSGTAMNGVARYMIVCQRSRSLTCGWP